MASTRITATLEAELQAVAEQLGCELLHVEFRGGVLQMVLDRDSGGVTLDDCEQFSKLASAVLDLEDFGRDRYVLEVSSPGLDRQLYRPRDWERFQGRDVRVTFFEGAERKKRTVVGRLASWEGAGAGLATVVEPAGDEHRIALPDIKMARLVADVPASPAKPGHRRASTPEHPELGSSS